MEKTVPNIELNKLSLNDARFKELSLLKVRDLSDNELREILLLRGMIVQSVFSVNYLTDFLKMDIVPDRDSFMPAKDIQSHILVYHLEKISTRKIGKYLKKMGIDSITKRIDNRTVRGYRIKINF